MNLFKDKQIAISSFLQKYKYAVLILLLGIGLLLLPGSHSESKEQTESIDPSINVADTLDYETMMEEKIATALSEIQGVGKVKVLLTLKQGEEYHYLTDPEQRSEAKDSGTLSDRSEKTVILSRGSSYDEAIVTRRDYPVFQGALIVCEGGGDAQIKLQLIQAVSALTNLGSQNITILKMK